MKQETRTTLAEGQCIHKASVVKHRVKMNHRQEVTNWYVRKVFRKELGLKYKKVKKISYAGNSEKSLVLRQQFAIRMFALLRSGKRILNIDETWLNETSFQRRKWKEHGTSNSVTSR